jgi:hypothetical protein
MGAWDQWEHGSMSEGERRGQAHFHGEQARGGQHTLRAANAEAVGRPVGRHTAVSSHIYEADGTTSTALHQVHSCTSSYLPVARGDASGASTPTVACPHGGKTRGREGGAHPSLLSAPNTNVSSNSGCFSERGGVSDVRRRRLVGRPMVIGR